MYVSNLEAGRMNLCNYVTLRYMLNKHKTVDNVVIVVIVDIVKHHYQLSLVSFYMESGPI